LVIRTEDTALQASLDRYCEFSCGDRWRFGLIDGCMIDDEMPPFMSTARVLVNPEQVETSEWTFDASIDVSTGTSQIGFRGIKLIDLSLGMQMDRPLDL
jgi:hypothetical protein